MFDRWLGTTIRFFTWAVMAAVITACGGGGGGGDGGGFLGPDTSPTYTLTLQSFDQSGAVSTSLSRTTPLTIVATLKEGNKVLPGEAVTLTTSVGTVSPTNGSALTDENGQATFEITYSGVVGAGEVAASFTKDGVSAEATIAIQAQDIGAPTLTVESFDADGNPSTSISRAAPLTVVATLRQNDAVLVGELISLSTSLGVVSPDNGSALTDENGQATFTLSFDGELGGGEVVVSFAKDGESAEATIAIQSVDISPYALEIKTSAPSGVASRAFSELSPLQVEATLTP